MKNKQKGFIVSYVLVGIGLLVAAVSVASIMKGNSSQKAALHALGLKIKNQASDIHSVIASCATIYASGNNGTGFHREYPAGTAADVLTLDCPGSSYANKNLWTGRDGTVPPVSVNGLNGWKYTNDATGVFITNTGTTDTMLNAAMLNASKFFATNQTVITGNTFKYWILKE